MANVYAYVRVSIRAKDWELQRQVRLCRESVIMLTSAPLSDDNIVYDLCNGNAPLWHRLNGAGLMERLEEGDIVVTSSLDRLCKTWALFLETVRRFEEIGAKFIAVATPGIYDFKGGKQ